MKTDYLADAQAKHHITMDREKNLFDACVLYYMAFRDKI